RVLVVFDGTCVLCSALARFILRHDAAAAFRFTPAQSPLGQALYRHYGLDPQRLPSHLVLTQGRAYVKLDSLAVTRARLGGRWRLLGALRLLPRRLADAAYDCVASNRYRLFGRAESCMIPPPQWHDRFIGL